MPISSPLLPTTPSQVYASHKSLGDIKGSYSSFDPHCAYLEDGPRKIMWSTFFDLAFDFSMAFGKFKRALTPFACPFVVFSYLHHCEMHAITFDKLLRPLIAFELQTRVLRD